MRVPLLTAALVLACPLVASAATTFGAESSRETMRYPYSAISSRPAVKPRASADQKTVLAALQATLTELQQLQLQTKQAHWNVSGPEFYQLHEMLQEHYEGLAKDADTVAERMLAIGGSADGRAHTIIADSSVPEIPGGFLDGAFVVRWFTDAYARAGERVDRDIRKVEDLDPTTANLLQEVETSIAKYQWQARAFTQSGMR